MTAEGGQCPACNGTGWIEKSTPLGAVATRCKCFEKDEPLSKHAALRIPQKFADKSFDNLSAGRFAEDEAKHKVYTAAIVKAKRFADEFPVGRRCGLLFHGGSPKDQTHLAVATLKHLADRGFSGAYWDYYQLMLALRKRNDPVSEVSAAGAEAARQVASVDVLLLDSLGSHRPTEWVLDTICAIVKHLYLNEKCLLVTTGLPLEAAQREQHDDFHYQRAYSPVHTSLADRIGPESVSWVLDHCDEVSMAVQRPPEAGPERFGPTL